MDNAIKARQSSKEKYINSIYTFWKNYYELQSLTLYDLENRTNLTEDFELLLDKK